MSENYGATPPGGTVDTAKQEASDLASTAKTEATDVVDTAKDQAASVAHEARTQAKDLYRTTTRELREQAGTQQQRLADGLRSVGDELDSMAESSAEPGVASDLVQQVSRRVGSAASWLSERDPSSVMDEVKRYARRKPGTFIAIAAVAGVVVGRLTRALASAASDEKDDAQTGSSAVPATASAVPTASAAADTPVYRDLTDTTQGALPGEAKDNDRPNSL